MIHPSDVWKGIRNPKRGLFELYKILDQDVLRNRPVSVMDEDWDNLIILDACRNDLFRDVCQLNGNLKTFTSAATNTLGFLRENFGDGAFPETVYVSSNPNLQLIDAKFHDRIRLWESDWDSELGVVPPEDVTAAAIEVQNQYPNKRLIIHYMQPHYPFIGETGKEMRESGEVNYQFEHGDDFWRQLASDSVNTDRFKQAYQENLEIVLDKMPELCEALNGKTVITSDHGNEFGKFGVYGHPAGPYTTGLVRVPWLERPFERRKSITEGTASEGPRREYDIAEERLVLLGYKNKVSG